MYLTMPHHHHHHHHHHHPRLPQINYLLVCSAMLVQAKRQELKYRAKAKQQQQGGKSDGKKDK